MLIETFVIHGFPWAEVEVHGDWTIVIYLDTLREVQYEVLYWTSEESELSAGIIQFPAAKKASNSANLSRLADD